LRRIWTPSVESDEDPRAGSDHRAISLCRSPSASAIRKRSSTPAFFDGEFGYRLRTGGPPDEWHADVTLGLKPAPGMMLTIQDFTTVSTAAVNRSFQAWRTSVVEASIVIAIYDRWSVQFGLFTSVLAVKTNTQHGVALAVWRTF